MAEWCIVILTMIYSNVDCSLVQGDDQLQQQESAVSHLVGLYHPQNLAMLRRPFIFWAETSVCLYTVFMLTESHIIAFGTSQLSPMQKWINIYWWLQSLIAVRSKQCEVYIKNISAWWPFFQWCAVDWRSKMLNLTRATVISKNVVGEDLYHICKSFQHFQSVKIFIFLLVVNTLVTHL